jgi:hypothetical protein
MGGGLRLDVHVGSFGIWRMTNSLAKDRPRLESVQVSVGGVLFPRKLGFTSRSIERLKLWFEQRDLLNGGEV